MSSHNPDLYSKTTNTPKLAVRFLYSKYRSLFKAL